METNELRGLLNGRVEEICEKLLPAGKRVGHQWKVGNVSGDPGDSMDVELEGPKAGLWHDLSNNEGGDIFDLVNANQAHGNMGLTFKWAREYLGVPNTPRDPSAPRPTDPLKVGFKSKDETVWRYGSKAWTYHAADGSVIGWVVRFDLPDGKKDILPLRIIDGTPRFRGWKNPDCNPIYNLHKLTSRPDAPVLVVEGEKTADAAARQFPGCVCITWQGGSGRASAVDWKPLLERQTPIRLWPDADKAGRDAMTYLKARLPNALVVRTDDLPDGWDLADPVPDGISIQGLFDAAGVTMPAPPPEPAAEAPPFRFLGYTDSCYHYLASENGLITKLPAPAHSESNLLTIAPLAWWESRFPGSKTRIDWHDAMDWLFRAGHSAGYFDPSRIRGAGCWVEADDSVVFHAGDRLYVNGVEKPIHEHDSPYYYPVRKTRPIQLSKAASLSDRAKLTAVCERFPWRDPSKSWVLSGWVFSAIVCGALDWRPHLTLNGESGSGKSYIWKSYIAPILGPISVCALSSTTEAGIRHSLGCDALPVLMDEAEVKDERSAKRIQGILELSRMASAETGAAIIKGSASGEAVTYRVRSCFLLSSIAKAATEFADESRFAQAELVKRHAEDPAIFLKTRQLIAATTGQPDFCEGIRSRAISMAAVIRATAGIFQQAIVNHLGDARRAQQYGPIAAGHWCLGSDEAPTPEEAAEWVASQWPLDAEADEPAIDTDKIRAVDILMEHRTTLQDDSAARFDHTVSELLSMFYANKPDPRAYAARETLTRLGVYPSYNGVHVAVRHTSLSSIYRGTQFDDRWTDNLRQIDGAKTSVYTPYGEKSKKSTILPLVACGFGNRAESVQPDML